MSTNDERDFGRTHQATKVLIVGAGPAGASAAVFLGKHGIHALMISRHSGTADTPRAHITNQRTMEALRDVGLEKACMAHASPSEFIEHSFWLRSMAGEELARTYAWGNDPARMGDYAAASPCRMCDLPQTELEPILIAEARRLGCDVRFHTELISFEQDADGVTALIVDRRSGQTEQVRAQYMIGAEGEAWRDAAASVSAHLGVKVEVISIGPFMDYEDHYGQWRELVGIETNGCILVRPDLYIAWRSKSLVEDPTAELYGVMSRILNLADSAGTKERSRSQCSGDIDIVGSDSVRASILAL